jgi:hypothetical protein
MAKCKLLAFLLCEKATAAPKPDNVVTLHHVFDRIAIPKTPDLIFAYYKIVVVEPCVVALRVVDPLHREIRRNWRHSRDQVGPVQGLWALYTGDFEEPGTYILELDEVTDDSEPRPLATMHLAVEQEAG